jgi:hypothetical protein
MSSMEFNRTHPLPSVIKVPKVGLNIRSQNVSIKLDFPETDAPTILRQEWHQCDGREIKELERPTQKVVVDTFRSLNIP